MAKTHSQGQFPIPFLDFPGMYIRDIHLFASLPTTLAKEKCMAQLDHIMYGVPDLEEAVAEFEKKSGVRPVFGGAHSGQGTHNALVSLGKNQYLEIIAPDPAQNLSGTLGETLLKENNPSIRTWAVATDNLDQMTTRAGELSLSARSIINMDRTTPAGLKLEWQIMFISGYDQLPFFINWQNSPHPAQNTPTGCSLIEFTIQTPEAQQYQHTMEGLGIQVSVSQGTKCFRVRIQTPNGELEL